MVTADMVKDLRQKTGARMMDCKAALDATSDFNAAVDWLKKKNLDTEVGGKPSAEGLLGCFFNSGLSCLQAGEVGPPEKSITVVELSASTDFACQSDDFRSLLRHLVGRADFEKIGSVEALNAAQYSAQQPGATGFIADPIVDRVRALAGRVGENIFIKRVVRMTGEFGYYIHFDNKQGAVVQLEGATGELAEKIGKDIAMHIVFAKPDYLSREQVPQADVDREKAIIESRLKDDPKNSKKPPEIIEKIVTGQLAKFFSQKVIGDQGYYKDEKKPLSQILKDLGVKIVRFERFQVGGEIAELAISRNDISHECVRIGNPHDPFTLKWDPARYRIRKAAKEFS